MNASKLLKQCSTLAKQSGKSNISIYSKLLKFQALPKFCLLDGLTDGLPQDSVLLGAGLQIFHKLCTVALDLQISWSAEELATAPPSFLLTIIGLPSSSLFH